MARQSIAAARKKTAATKPTSSAKPRQAIEKLTMDVPMDNKVIERSRPKGDHLPDSSPTRLNSNEEFDLSKTIDAAVSLHRDVKELEHWQKDHSNLKLKGHLDVETLELLSKSDKQSMAYGIDDTDWGRIFAGTSTAVPGISRIGKNREFAKELEVDENVVKRPPRFVRLCPTCVCFYSSLPLIQQ